jgi:hypothetical protein
LLRHQLAILRRSVARPCVTRFDRIALGADRSLKSGVKRDHSCQRATAGDTPLGTDPPRIRVSARGIPYALAKEE